MRLVEADRSSRVRLGLEANWPQFTLLVIVNAFVGGMVGLERTVVPLLAEQSFGIVSQTVTLSFIISFGVVKAFTNLLTGRLSDRIGRKPLLVVGWLFGLPVPLLIIVAPAWEWIVFANVLLGVNQGLCWSTTVIMKIDLAGAARRGLAVGLNESAGYIAVSLSALATGYIASVYALRPHPFYLGVVLALLGLIFSLFFVRETHDHAKEEARQTWPVYAPSDDRASLSFAQIVALTSWKDRALFATSQAGLANNLNDSLMWGLLPIFLANAGVSLYRIGIVAASYAAVWGVGQLLTGALSDRLGRKRMIVVGLWVQAAGILMIVLVNRFLLWTLAAVLMGLGTALVYPTLLAAISDVAHPDWRASALGVYRLWRDSGYAIGALLSGVLADLLGMPATIFAISSVTALSGVIVALTMYETLPHAPIPSVALEQPEP